MRSTSCVLAAALLAGASATAHASVTDQGACAACAPSFLRSGAESTTAFSLDLRAQIENEAPDAQEGDEREQSAPPDDGEDPDGRDGGEPPDDGVLPPDDANPPADDQPPEGEPPPDNGDDPDASPAPAPPSDRDARQDDEPVPDDGASQRSY